MYNFASLTRDVNKDSGFKAKARTKDCNFVLKDNQGPRTKAKDNIPVVNCVSSSHYLIKTKNT